MFLWFLLATSRGSAAGSPGSTVTGKRKPSFNAFRRAAVG